jgi:predicted cobalt transporter CbtA
MLTNYITRGLKAGVIAGIAFGLFMALVGNPLVAYAETFEQVSHHGGHGGPVVSGAVTTAVSILGGVLVGMLFGAVAFGAVFYFLEPAIPGAAGTGTKSYVLGAAGFVIVSGAPWLVLPPQPPGVEQALAIDTRLTWYLVMMVVGAFACGLAGYAYTRLRSRFGRTAGFVGGVCALALIPIVAAIAPANTASGPISDGVAYVFRTIVAVGQVGLWFVLASAHAWFVRRDRTAESNEDQRTTVADASRSISTD